MTVQPVDPPCQSRGLGLIPLVAVWEAQSHAVAWKAGTAGTTNIGMLPRRIDAPTRTRERALGEVSAQRAVAASHLGTPFVASLSDGQTGCSRPFNPNRSGARRQPNIRRPIAQGSDRRAASRSASSSGVAAATGIRRSRAGSNDQVTVADIGDLGTRLQANQQATEVVPRCRSPPRAVDVPVEPPGGDGAQIEGGRPQDPVLLPTEVPAGIAVQRDDRLLQHRAPARLDGTAVEAGAAAPDRLEAHAPGLIDHHRRSRPVAHRARTGWCSTRARPGWRWSSRRPGPGRRR